MTHIHAIPARLVHRVEELDLLAFVTTSRSILERLCRYVYPRRTYNHIGYPSIAYVLVFTLAVNPCIVQQWRRLDMAFVNMSVSRVHLVLHHVFNYSSGYQP